MSRYFRCKLSSIRFVKEAFAANLRALRKSYKLKQTELAEKIGTTQRNISYWENGMTQPDIDTLARIADFFDITIDELVGRK